MPMGAPSSELTGWLRRYSWSSRRSSTWQLPRKLTTKADGSQLAGQEMQAGLVQDADHFAEQHVDAAGALLHDGVDSEEAARAPSSTNSATNAARNAISSRS